MLKFIQMISSVCLIVISILIFTFYLDASSEQFAANFKNQNKDELASGDAFSLANRLNAIAVSRPDCMIGWKGGREFFRSKSGSDQCDVSVLNRLVVVSNDALEHRIKIHFYYRLPFFIEMVFFLFTVLQVFLLCVAVYLAKKNQKLSSDKELKILKMESEQHLAYVHIAQQVAHDIKSPLAALGVLQQDLIELPEEKRILLRSAVKRIGDIANDLSNRKDKSEEALRASGIHLKGVSDKQYPPANSDERDVHLIPAIVESLVSEKRLQHRSKMNVEIESDLTADSYGLFARVELREFKRVLSNLVNNAVEAMGERGGVVRVDLRCGGYQTTDDRRWTVDGGRQEICDLPIVTCVTKVSSDQSVHKNSLFETTLTPPVERQPSTADTIESNACTLTSPPMISISISDTGKGIAPDILPKLMQRGQTHGKSGGSGLGLYHAKTTMQGWGGDVTIASELGKGTTVTLTLPRAPLPDWFVPELKIMPGSTVVIVDDDHSIHEIWKNRLGKLVKENGVSLKHFSSPVDCPSGGERGQGGELYLCDYEYIGIEETGLDLIERLGVGSRAFLVTSHFEEAGVRARCKKLGVQLLPKNLSGFVPLHADHGGCQAQADYAGRYTVDGERQAQADLPIVTCVTRVSSDQSVHKNSPFETTPASTVERQPSTVTDEISPPHQLDAILIDDDPLVHMNWKMKARVSKKLLRTFTQPDKFFAELKGLDRKTPIYVDSSLGDNLKGEDVTKALSEQGFTNLYLATGYDKSRFPHMPWVKDIVDKMPPWVS